MAATRTQYRLVQAIPLIPVGIVFILSFWCPETPRFLASKQRHDEAKQVLARLRGTTPDDPAVETSELYSRAKVLENHLQKLVKKRAPKKKKAAAESTTSSSSRTTTTSASSQTTSAAKGDSTGTSGGHDEL